MKKYFLGTDGRASRKITWASSKKKWLKSQAFSDKNSNREEQTEAIFYV